MKKIMIILSAAVIMASCGNNKHDHEHEGGAVAEESSEKATGSFGAKIDEAGAVTIDKLMADMGNKTEMPAKVTGTITECCSKKGCWMNIDKGDGTTMKVTFKDYGFFVPKNSSGHTAIMQGRVYMDTLSVDMLRHYAEDAGKSEEEIAKITEPKTEMAFEAEGVIIK